MRLTQRCKSDFPKIVQKRGAAYAKENRVKFHEYSEINAFGEVTGSQKYSFEIDFSRVEDDLLGAYCECPYFEDHFACKHLWAALIELDARGIGDLVPGTWSLDIESMDLFLLRPDFYMGLGEFEPEPKPATWQDRLRAISADVAPIPQPTATKSQLWLGYSEAATHASYYPFKGFDIDFYLRDRLKTGNFGKLKRRSLGAKDLPRFDENDRGILELLLGLAASYDPEMSYYFSHPNPSHKQKSVRVSHLMLPNLLPRLCEWGRFGLVAEGDSDITPLRFSNEPWGWMLKGQDLQDELVLQPAITRHTDSGQQICPKFQGAILSFGWAIDRHSHVIAPFPDAPKAIAWINQSEREGPLRIPQADEQAALQTLWSIPGLPPTHLPERLQLKEVQGTFEPHISFRSPKPSLFVGEAKFLYGDRALSPVDPIRQWHRDDEMVRRDLDGEASRRQELEGLQPRLSLGTNGSVDVKASDFAEIVSALHAFGWIVEAEHQRVRSSGGFSASVASGIDWFEVSGSMVFDDVRVELPELLAAARRRARFVTLDDGSTGILPDAWLNQFAAVADLAVDGKKSKSGVRFQNRQALLLDSLLAASGEAVDVDEKFEQIRQRLNSFDRLEPQEAPPTFQGRLRAYQSLGLAWMTWMAELGLGGCLADDMGLGKTIQVLAFLEQRRLNGELDERWGLLVVPRSLLHNWLQESHRFTPELPVHIHHGPGRKRLLQDLRSEGLPHILITTYGTLIRDIVSLSELELDIAVLDEAQAIKNPKSQTAKACRLVPARHRLALTGTPVENHLGELWSIFEFLNPGMLGRLPTLSGMAGKKQLPAESLKLVAQGIRPLILRRTKGEVLKDLPEKTEQTLACELSKKERARYDDLLAHYRARLSEKVETAGFGRSKMHVLEALLRLRQAACHPGLMSPDLADEPSAKLDLLIDRLREVVQEGHKALVFSQFTKFLAIVKKSVEKEGWNYEYLDGRTRKREQRVARFQEDPDCRLFLISLKAGGVGLNLTAAEYIFLLDPWWNPAVESQAVDRAHRIGQQNPVFAYRLIGRDTVEEKILELQASKRALADAVITQDKGVLSAMTAEDLELLLGGPLARSAKS